jgi:hypothetical protein
VVVRDGYLAQGIYQENLFIIGPVGDRVEQLFFFFDAGGENKGLCEGVDKDADGAHECFAYDSTITFHQGSNANYFDIEIVREGTNVKDYSSVKAFEEAFLYRFNGCSYEKGPVALFSDDRFL